MKILRRKSKVIKIGKVKIGGGNPVLIQSMAKTKTSDIEGAVKQIKCLELAGCEIVRLAVKDESDAKALKLIKHKVSIPVVADIHFDYRLALIAIESGVDKIRLNPGNIYKENEISQVISALKGAGIPMRVGLNSGSVKYSGNKKLSVADKLVRSCLDYLKIIEKFKFYNMVISLKASTVLDTVEAYRKISKVCDYPLHLGVTATGLPQAGAIKSSIAIGSLLMDGIGDTLRISLTDNSVEEIKAAKCILEALELRNFGPQIISCPTCGRCEVNLVNIVGELEDKLSGVTHGLPAGPFKIAVMGCVVNGPGEAKEADIGIAFGKNQGLFFKKGKPIRKISVKDSVNVLLKELKNK